MFVFVENTMDNLQFIENADYTGSSGIMMLGNNPDDLTYELDTSPNQPVDGKII